MNTTPDIDVTTQERLAKEAEELLRENDRDGYTIPSPHLYPHQWAWDSAFAAIGWLHIDPERAVAEIESLTEHQWDGISPPDRPTLERRLRPDPLLARPHLGQHQLALHRRPRPRTRQIDPRHGR